MALRIEHFGQHDRVGHAVGPILDALAPLVLDHVALGVDGLWRHGVEQVPHAIRFEEEREFECVRGYIDHVVGAIVLGRPVVVATDRFEQLVEFARLHVSRTHEHEVFEEVREACPSRLLARRPDVIPDVHRHDGHAVILVEDDVQPVGQRELRVGKLQRRGRLRKQRPWQQNSKAGNDRELH